MVFDIGERGASIHSASMWSANFTDEKSAAWKKLLGGIEIPPAAAMNVY
jgi:hypothetical protein